MDYVISFVCGFWNFNFQGSIYWHYMENLHLCSTEERKLHRSGWSHIHVWVKYPFKACHTKREVKNEVAKWQMNGLFTPEWNEYSSGWRKHKIPARTIESATRTFNLWHQSGTEPYESGKSSLPSTCWILKIKCQSCGRQDRNWNNVLMDVMNPIQTLQWSTNHQYCFF